MEQIKEKGFFRKIIEWLNRVDEEEVNDSGDINEKAFAGEDAQILEALKKQTEKIDSMGNTMFIDRGKRRENTVTGMKAKVETPSMNKKVVRNKEYEQEYEQEQ